MFLRCPASVPIDPIDVCPSQLTFKGRSKRQFGNHFHDLYDMLISIPRVQISRDERLKYKAAFLKRKVFLVLRPVAFGGILSTD